MSQSRAQPTALIKWQTENSEGRKAKQAFMSLFRKLRK